MPSSTRIPAAETGQTARSSAVVVAILFAIVCLTWGTTWLGIKLAVDTVPPLLAAGLRFVIAFPLLYLIARAQRAPLLFPEGQGGLFVLIVILYFALPYLLIGIGYTFLTADRVDFMEAQLSHYLPAGANVAAFGESILLWPLLLLHPLFCG